MTANDAQAQTLYQRLGGYDSIAAATDDLLGRLQSDPRIKDFWKGASADNQRKARQLIVDFLSEAAGGPTYYNGRDMRLSHDGMHISASDWEVFMRHSAAMLAHFEVPERETQEVLGFFTSLKDEVIQQ